MSMSHEAFADMAVFALKEFLFETRRRTGPNVALEPFVIYLVPDRLHIAYKHDTDPPPLGIRYFSVLVNVDGNWYRFDIRPWDVPAERIATSLKHAGITEDYNQILSRMYEEMRHKLRQYIEMHDQETKRQRELIPDLVQAVRDLNKETEHMFLVSSLVDSTERLLVDKMKQYMDIFRVAVEELNGAVSYDSFVSAAAHCIEAHLLSAVIYLNHMCREARCIRLVLGPLVLKIKTYQHPDLAVECYCPCTEETPHPPAVYDESLKMHLMPSILSSTADQIQEICMWRADNLLQVINGLQKNPLRLGCSTSI